jgi:deazaflavin-dependent oxidoreductase (nitroreductase family)
MPLPKSLASFNKRVTNHVTRAFAGWLPGFAIVTHVGRRSAREYRTPVNVFRRGDEYVFALTYGARSDWVKNVEAAGQCTIRTRRRTVHLAEPRRFTDAARSAMPAPVRVVLGLIQVDEFLGMRPAPGRS